MSVKQGNVNDQVKNMLDTVQKEATCCGALFSKILKGRTVEELQRLAAEQFPHCLMCKFAVPSGNVAYYFGVHPVKGFAEVVRSDQLDLVVTFPQGTAMDVALLIQEYDAALSKHFEEEQKQEEDTVPTGTDWRQYVSKCLETLIPEQDVLMQSPAKPQPDAPDNFAWLVLKKATYAVLVQRVENLKCGWDLISVLEKVKVHQTPEILVYWAPEKILLFFGILEE